MTKDVDWPGRGGTWLAGLGLIALVVGAGVLLTAYGHRTLSQELLRDGVRVTASAVQVEVLTGRVNVIEEVRVEFVADDRPVRAVLGAFDDDRQGMDEGVHAPAVGTRYAMPLQLAYRKSDPSVVLAVVDAESWAQDVLAERYGLTALIVGGGGLLWAPVMLSRSARRRGLAWWKWYSRG